ncbi:MAG: HDOD domain-containing protein [Betaproteobacteria bacterium]|nr:MAG: HDOD domain-containing protein [Betaproteobacteria bacterium]
MLMGEPTSLMQAVEQALASGSLQIPVYSATASRLQAIVAQEDADAKQVEQVLNQDPALAAQVLRVANSPFYGGLSKISTVSGAAQRLGLRQVVNIAVLTAQRAAHASADPTVKALMQRLWQHSVGCAIGAKWLAEHASCREHANEAFMAGLLHDVGSLLLLRVLESLRSRQPEQPMPESLVLEVIAALHADQGARLIRHWGLPESYAAVAANHHGVESDPDTVTQLVRVANEACHKLGMSLTPDPSIRLSTLPETASLGVREIVLAELEIAIEDGVSALA